jgi:hypothetical protein
VSSFSGQITYQFLRVSIVKVHVRNKYEIYLFTKALEIGGPYINYQDDEQETCPVIVNKVFIEVDS